MRSADFVLQAAPEFSRSVRPLHLPEQCWADRVVTVALTPMLSQCKRDAVREGLCAGCYREIFGKDPA